MRTYSNGKNVYSVDMMLSYINLANQGVINHNLKVVKVPISDLESVMSFKGWGDPTKKKHSPSDVLENPALYKDDMKRIKMADLKYPIIMDSNGYVVDGVHRMVKAQLENKKHVKAYVFNPALMKKFLIDKNKDWDKVDSMELHELCTMLFARFYQHFG